MYPPAPAAACPVSSTMKPLSPSVLAPVVARKAPEAPLAPAGALPTCTLPLLLRWEAPESRDTSPPLPPAALPPCSTRGPPALAMGLGPVASPPEMYTPPPCPPEGRSAGEPAARPPSNGAVSSVSPELDESRLAVLLLPPLMSTRPPVAPGEVVAPAVTATGPPSPVSPAPARRYSPPPGPPRAFPVVRLRAPEGPPPETVGPVLMAMLPEGPLVPAAPVARAMLPLARATPGAVVSDRSPLAPGEPCRSAAGAPESRERLPPLPLPPLPPLTSTLPPCPAAAALGSVFRPRPPTISTGPPTPPGEEVSPPDSSSLPPCTGLAVAALPAPALAPGEMTMSPAPTAPRAAPVAMDTAPLPPAPLGPVTTTMAPLVKGEGAVPRNMAPLLAEVEVPEMKERLPPLPPPVEAPPAKYTPPPAQCQLWSHPPLRQSRPPQSLWRTLPQAAGCRPLRRRRAGHCQPEW